MQKERHIWAWGNNMYGQLGIKISSNANMNKDVKIEEDQEQMDYDADDMEENSLISPEEKKQKMIYDNFGNKEHKSKIIENLTIYQP